MGLGSRTQISDRAIAPGTPETGGNPTRPALIPLGGVA
jgi:hypothetical protein